MLKISIASFVGYLLVAVPVSGQSDLQNCSDQTVQLRPYDNGSIVVHTSCEYVAFNGSLVEVVSTEGQDYIRTLNDTGVLIFYDAINQIWIFNSQASGILEITCVDVCATVTFPLNAPMKPENGSVTYLYQADGTTVGSYECDEGYKLVGNRRRVFMPVNRTLKWSGTDDPVCRSISVGVDRRNDMGRGPSRSTIVGIVVVVVVIVIVVLVKCLVPSVGRWCHHRNKRLDEGNETGQYTAMPTPSNTGHVRYSPETNTKEHEAVSNDIGSSELVVRTSSIIYRRFTPRERPSPVTQSSDVHVHVQDTTPVQRTANDVVPMEPLSHAQEDNNPILFSSGHPDPTAKHIGDIEKDEEAVQTSGPVERSVNTGTRSTPAENGGPAHDPQQHFPTTKNTQQLADKEEGTAMVENHDCDQVVSGGARGDEQGEGIGDYSVDLGNSGLEGQNAAHAKTCFLIISECPSVLKLPSVLFFDVPFAKDQNKGSRNSSKGSTKSEAKAPRANTESDVTGKPKNDCFSFKRLNFQYPPVLLIVILLATLMPAHVALTQDVERMEVYSYVGGRYRLIDKTMWTLQSDSFRPPQVGAFYHCALVQDMEVSFLLRYLDVGGEISWTSCRVTFSVFCVCLLVVPFITVAALKLFIATCLCIDAAMPPLDDYMFDSKVHVAMYVD